MPAADKHAQGIESWRAGRSTEAAILFGEALVENESAEGWNDWATAQMSAGNAANAEVGFRRALQLDPERNEARVNLGVLLAQSRRPSEALALLESLASASSEDGEKFLAAIVSQCRDAVAGSGATGPLAAAAPIATPSIPERLNRLLARQTVALSSALLRITALESHLQTQAPSLRWGRDKTARIPLVPPRDLLSGAPEIDLLALDSTEENVSLLELTLIATLVRKQNARAAFEIGTADGRTTLNLAANCATNGSKRSATCVWTLNIPRDGLGRRIAASPLRSRISQLLGDSASFDFSPYAGRADFVFIDANHDYEYVLSDSCAALTLLREGQGTIAWHDYAPHWPGVVRGLDELFATHARFAEMRQVETTSLVYATVSKQ